MTLSKALCASSAAAEIGTTLARRVVHCARANGFALLTAITPWEDRPARALLRCLEFRARASHDGVIELELGPPNAQPAEIYGAMATEEPRPAPRAGPLAEAPAYPPLCVHGMNPLTDRGYDLALGRLRRG